MTHIKDFNKRFGVRIEDDVVKHKLIQRINIALEPIEYYFRDRTFLKWLTVEYGQRFDLEFTDSYSDGTIRIKSGFSVSHIYGDDFVACLKLLEFLRMYLKLNRKSEALRQLDIDIEDALDRSEKDLGIRWHDGKFYPSGAKVLDEKLVEDVLDWLNDYPEEKIDFNKATTALVERRYGDAIGDCNTCLEGIARKVLKNKKALSDNRDEFLKYLKLSGQWSRILANYIDYANEYGKHASEKRHKVDPNEAEAFLYTTGLMIRLVINTVKNTKA
jgi:hypothetical protein